MVKKILREIKEKRKVAVSQFVEKGILEKAYIALARRGVDSIESHEKGPLGTIILEDSIPSPLR